MKKLRVLMDIDVKVIDWISYEEQGAYDQVVQEVRSLVKDEAGEVFPGLPLSDVKNIDIGFFNSEDPENVFMAQADSWWSLFVLQMVNFSNEERKECGLNVVSDFFCDFTTCVITMENGESYQITFLSKETPTMFAIFAPKEIALATFMRVCEAYHASKEDGFDLEGDIPSILCHVISGSSTGRMTGCFSDLYSLKDFMDSVHTLDESGELIFSVSYCSNDELISIDINGNNIDEGISFIERELSERVESDDN
jgi:hypothetical protein